MVLNIGDISISSRPENLIHGTCSYCGLETDEVAIDLSFYDSFGRVEDWEVGSNCCGSPVIPIEENFIKNS